VSGPSGWCSTTSWRGRHRYRRLRPGHRPDDLRPARQSLGHGPTAPGGRGPPAPVHRRGRAPGVRGGGRPGPLPLPLRAPAKAALHQPFRARDELDRDGSGMPQPRPWQAVEPSAGVGRARGRAVRWSGTRPARRTPGRHVVPGPERVVLDSDHPAPEQPAAPDPPSYGLQRGYPRHHDVRRDRAVPITHGSAGRGAVGEHRRTSSTGFMVGWALVHPAPSGSPSRSAASVPRARSGPSASGPSGASLRFQPVRPAVGRRQTTGRRVRQRSGRCNSRADETGRCRRLRAGEATARGSTLRGPGPYDHEAPRA